MLRLTASEFAAISARNRAARRPITVDLDKEQCHLCGRLFDTEHGFRVHFSTKHSGQPITRNPKKNMRAKPGYEGVLAGQCAGLGLPPCEREYRFNLQRRWRVDLAWPGKMLAVEIDGAVHRIKARFHADIEKHQALFFAGWRLLRVSTQQVRSGDAVKLVQGALA